MKKITCDMCMDLMPLVQDGVASEDSAAAVCQHIQNCPVCRSVYEGQIPMRSEAQIIKKIQRKIQLFIGMVLMFGMFFGLSLTASSKMFLNILIMPLVGGIGYYLFRWKACYIVPVLLFITHFFTNIAEMIRGAECLSVYEVGLWTGIYSFFAVIGTLIVGLLHFVFRKENS